MNKDSQLYSSGWSLEFTGDAQEGGGEADMFVRSIKHVKQSDSFCLCDDRKSLSSLPPFRDTPRRLLSQQDVHDHCFRARVRTPSSDTPPMQQTDGDETTECVEAAYEQLQSPVQICYEFLRITTKDLFGTFTAALDEYCPRRIKLYRARKGAFGQAMENLLDSLDEPHLHGTFHQLLTAGQEFENKALDLKVDDEGLLQRSEERSNDL
ncbi:hypothetical protein NQZ68_035674 [Dissostichus eleginoides]|nr:hypothetical protein NQZ68_035674 [Dissostichus eleginoides]